MASRTKLTTFNKRVDSLLQGIADTVLKSADRDLAIREAIGEYNQDAPKRLSVEFAGDASAYYLLFGKHVDEGGTPTTGIDLPDSGANEKIGVKFTLDRTMVIQQFSFKLKRTGAVVEGHLTGEIFTDASDLPDVLVATADTVNIDDEEDGAPVGFYELVHFELEKPKEFPAGTYHIVIGTSGYTYADGTEEVIVGVEQGASVTANVSTYDGGSWSAFSPASEGKVEVLASTPGWRSYMGRPLRVEYPAADVSADEDPQIIEDDEWEIFLAANGSYLRFLNHRPSTSESVRLELGLYYEWGGKGTPEIDTPVDHFEGLCYLAASYCCLRLASKFGQKRSSTLRADVADRKEQGVFYRKQAEIFRQYYDRMLGLGEEAVKQIGASMAVVDMDYKPTHGDYLFHGRKTR
jgi:hypothetical protein